mgnify:CR=1 FL=1
MFDKKEYSKKYYQDNKEKIKEYSKKYYYETSRPSKNIKPRQPKPYFKHIILEKPILICFN